MTISVQWILALGAAIMLALVVIEWARQRRWTPGIKARLCVAVLFSLVLAWNAWHGI